MKKTMIKLLSLLLACMLVFGLGTAVSASENTAALAGDINGDGVYSVLDVLMILKAILNGTEIQNADANGDGKVSLKDALYVLRKSVSTEAPEVGSSASGTADIEVKNGATKDAVEIDGETVSAAVPAGVVVEEGATKLTLSVTAMADTTGNITPGENENALSYDVHIEGISKDNNVPIIVDLGAILPAGQNLGTITLYHVEDGVTNEMTQVMTLLELDTHNEFYYYPATGNVLVALATFSEVAIVSDTVNAWEGNIDTSWYTEALAKDANTTEFTIANADQLAGFAKIVGGMADGINLDDFDGKTVTLVADVNLGDDEENNKENLIFYPIGYYFTLDENGDGTEDDVYSTVYSFKGTFNGNGHTVANFYQNTWEMDGDYNDGYPAGSNYYKDGMGLFGYVNGGTVQNLTVDNFSSDGEFTPTGVIAAYAVNATFKNIAITNCNPRVYNTGNGGIVGIGGNSDDTTDKKLTFANITVDNTNTISALWGSWDVACGGFMGMFRGNGEVSFTDCHVAAQIDVYNDVCANYQYYWYRYAGMMIGSIRKNTTANGYTIPDTTGITATNCTATLGDWADYYYCEFQKNSPASYSEDYQFSRVPESEIAFDENGNVTGCTHDHTETEDKQAVFLPFNQLFTGNGWGVKAIETFTGVEVTRLDAGKVKVSTEKFVASDVTKVPVGEAIAITDLFTAITEYTNYIHDTAVTLGVTSLVEDTIIEYTYTTDPTEWMNNTITFENTGSVKITIQDYFYCTPTTITVDIVESTIEVPVDKFTALNPTFTHTTEGGTIVKTLGDVFTAVENATIDSSAVEVTVTNGCVYEKNADDWTQSTLTFTGTDAVEITITDNNLCNTAVAEVTLTEPEVTDKFALVFENTNSYLYRVGNKNTVTLGNLFSTLENVTVGTVSIAIETIDGNATGTYTANSPWTAGTIKFTGTGVVTVTIDDNAYANSLSLNLEVVDATNVTTASFSGNTVLLKDVTTSSTLSTSGVVYGNGFTVNMEGAPIQEKNGAIFHLYDGAVLKNLSIVGKEYTTVATTVNDTDYGVSVVRAWGTVVIENCYISGCRAAVSVTGTELTIKDSVIANGIYANVDFRSGVLNLHNVTTVNEPHTVNGTTVLGLGIVGNMTASAGRKLNITGYLTQYNWVSQADCSNIKTSGIDSVFNSVFTEDKYAALRYTYDGTTYVNTGILSLCSDFGVSAVSGTPSNYAGMDVSATIMGITSDGYVWAPGEAGTLTDADMAYHDTVYAWTPDNQGTSFVAPAFNFSGVDLTVESGVVQIAYESGSSVTIPAETLQAILPAQKYGKTLDCEIWMNGVDYTGKDITFDATASQTYTVTYIITDNLIYDKTGALTDTTYAITKELKVFATVTDKTADAPTFTFYYGTNGSESGETPHTTQPTSTYASTIKQVGEVYYIMPNVSATSANAIGSQTIDGETVYYPIVDGINVRDGNSTDYNFTRYYPIFKAVTISDNGTEYSYASTTEMPDTATWVEATIDDGNSASSLSANYSLYNNQYLCKVQAKAGDTESGGTAVVKFSYTALDGNTYYYYVGYRFYDEDEGGVCVTPDTLVTMADGTQKRIDEVTYADSFLVWDFFSGAYTTAPASIIDNHGYATVDVLTVNFADGTSVNTINGHGFFDADLNKFVLLETGNVADHVGHTFLKANGDSFAETQLVSYTIEEKYTEVWSILTAEHYNCMLEGMLTLSPGQVDGSPEYLMPFAIGDDMKYDADAMAADIEKYGLYTYEDFADVITYEQFVALNLQYFKVSVGKGAITYEEILFLLNLHM